MGMHSNNCVWGHTACFPGKDRVRRNMIKRLQSDKRKPQGVVTVSHAAIPMFATLEHQGPIRVVDTDEASCAVARQFQFRNDGHRPGSFQS